jgi:hypothetical protein
MTATVAVPINIAIVKATGKKPEIRLLRNVGFAGCRKSNGNRDGFLIVGYGVRHVILWYCPI